MNQRTKNRVCLFIRVSTQKQDYDRQILELNNYCRSQGYIVTKTIATKITGSRTKADRPDLIELLCSSKKKLFDKVLVTEISRIGRNAKDIRNTIDQLHGNKIGIIFKNLGVESISEAGEESFVTNIIIAIYAELAQEEKRILIDRIKSGLTAAKAKGKQLGRPEGKEDKSTILKKYPNLVKDLKANISLRKAMKLHDVSKGTVIKIKKYLFSA
jgi:DNA invertase Pin-like site-specific DNA recombinase